MILIKMLLFILFCNTSTVAQKNSNEDTQDFIELQLAKTYLSESKCFYISLYLQIKK